MSSESNGSLMTMSSALKAMRECAAEAKTLARYAEGISHRETILMCLDKARVYGLASEAYQRYFEACLVYSDRER